MVGNNVVPCSCRHGHPMLLLLLIDADGDDDDDKDNDNNDDVYFTHASVPFLLCAVFAFSANVCFRRRYNYDSIFVPGSEIALWRRLVW